MCVCVLYYHKEETKLLTNTVRRPILKSHLGRINRRKKRRLEGGKGQSRPLDDETPKVDGSPGQNRSRGVRKGEGRSSRRVHTVVWGLT